MITKNLETYVLRAPVAFVFMGRSRKTDLSIPLAVGPEPTARTVIEYIHNHVSFPAQLVGDFAPSVHQKVRSPRLEQYRAKTTVGSLASICNRSCGRYTDSMVDPAGRLNFKFQIDISGATPR